MRIEAFLVGGATSLTVGVGLVYWYTLVHPDLVLMLLDEDDRSADPFFGGNPPALRALRWALAIVLFASSFATGALTSFLGRTLYY